MKTYTQTFKDGVLHFGASVGKMIFAKIDKLGGKAHEHNLSDLNLTSGELLEISKSLKQ